MPTKNQIIEELYRSKEFNECIGKMEPDYLQDDLRSEVMMVILETEEAKLQAIYERGELKFYAVRIILNLSNSSTSPFYKKFRRVTCTVHDDVVKTERARYADRGDELERPFNYHLLISEDDEIRKEELFLREQRELKEEKAMEVIDTLPWYDREIINLYKQLGSYREIEKATYVEAMGTGIPWESCYSTVQKAFKKIRHEISLAHIVFFLVPFFLLG